MAYLSCSHLQCVGLRGLFILMLVVVLGPVAALARPTSEQEARQAVKGWLRLDPHPLETALATTISQVVTYQDAQGTALYHVVTLTPQGMVIVAGDDEVEPIIGFLPEGSYDSSPDNPLGTLITADVPVRVGAARTRAAVRLQAAVPTLPAPVAQVKDKWQRLIGASQAGGVSLQGLQTLSDLRVPPLIKSRWSQLTVNGKACYNYYTPPGESGSPDNYYCGCGATAMAQLMRYYQWPRAGVGTGTDAIKIGDLSTTARLQGGDGNGGPYDWDNMPLVPHAGITEAQCQAIGALTHDAGVAAHTTYASSASSSQIEDTRSAFISTFHFENAIMGQDWIDEASGMDEHMNDMLNPDLDAGYPVLLPIYNLPPTAGHYVLCDGYGYESSTLYHHLNLGWSGYEDAWYNLPNVDDPGYQSIFEPIYNIFPAGTGEIISGRVTLANGYPIAGATVTATAGGSDHPFTTVSNNRGIYALAGIPSDTSYAVCAEKKGYSFAPQTVSVGHSVNVTLDCGNVWGVNLTSSEAPAVLSVSPCDPCAAIGSRDGPFEPASWTCTITNVGKAPLTWSITKTQPWLSLSKTGGGNLDPDSTDTVTVALNESADSLPPGSCNDTLTFISNGDGATTQPVTLAVSPWVQATPAAPWMARSVHAAVVYDNRIWVLGGWVGADKPKGDVWSSSDGVHWDCAITTAPWPARINHRVIVYDGKMWLLGGDDNSAKVFGDVWNSTDGVHWTQVTDQAPWGPRSYHSALVFDNRMWVMAGYDGTTYCNDIWSSTDGRNWTLVTTTAPWSARSGPYSAVFKGRMWLIGGYDGKAYCNDVWSSANGVDWTCVTPAAAWDARGGSILEVVGDCLWLAGGYGDDIGGSPYFYNDVWCSMDGANWRQFDQPTLWAARNAHSAVTFQNRLYILGGRGIKRTNDVYYLDVPPTPKNAIVPTTWRLYK